MSAGWAAEPLWPAAASENRPLDALGVGQNSVDRVVFFAALPPPRSEEDPADALELPGGQVATAMLACARLGLRVAYAGAVGDDAAAEIALAPLRRAGVGLAGVRVVPGARTRRAVIYVERRGGERHVHPRRDPGLRLPPEAIDPAQVRRARLLHVDGDYPEAAARAAGLARAAGSAVLLDLDAPSPGLDALLAQADFPIVSRRFAEWISGGSSAVAGLRELLRRGARLAVATLGPDGALALAPGGREPILCPGFRVEARDTTGAGDVFHAAFAFGLLQGWGASRVLRTANAAAALGCREIGAQGGLPDRTALEAFLAASDARDGAGG